MVIPPNHGAVLRGQACVHDYMKRRRRTENVRKREELEAERLAHEPDNLAVLAQVGSRLQASGLRTHLELHLDSALAHEPDDLAVLAQAGFQKGRIVSGNGSGARCFW
jgi:hypothetical protein